MRSSPLSALAADHGRPSEAAERCNAEMGLYVRTDATEPGSLRGHVRGSLRGDPPTRRAGGLADAVMLGSTRDGE
jgi:hypothetical protein